MSNKIAICLALALPCSPLGALVAQVPVDHSMDSSTKGDPAANAPPGMTYVPGGIAVIGLTEKEIQDMKLESILELNMLAGSFPQHKVPMKGFYLDNGEVTNHEWKIYLDATGQEPSEDLVNLYWKDGKIPDREDDQPVVGISHQEAEKYAAWAMKRLPTEAEWEYAARGAGGFRYPWGDEFDKDKAHWVNSKMVGGRKGQKTCTLPEGRSPFGLLDMAGNVWEYTSSNYVAYEGYRDIKVATRYTRGKLGSYSATGLFSAKKVVIRGGAWNTPKIALLSALRQPAEEREWNIAIGFRCARSTDAGVEAMAVALDEIGAHFFRGMELDLGSVIAKEVMSHDAKNAVTSFRGIAFAPVKQWEKLSEVQKKSLRDPVAVGLLYTTEEIIDPRLAPGAYRVAYQAGDEKARVPKNAIFPEDGWVYYGWEEHDPTASLKAAVAAKADADAKKKAAKKPAKKNGKEDAKEDAKPAEEEGDEAEENKEDEVRYEAAEGSVIYNLHVSNLLLVDSKNKVVAAFPIDAVKDGARPGPAVLTTQKVGEDKRRKHPATVRRTHAFTITVPGKKGVAFELPLKFHQGVLEAEKAKPSKVSDTASGKDH